MTVRRSIVRNTTFNLGHWYPCESPSAKIAIDNLLKLLSMRALCLAVLLAAAVVAGAGTHAHAEEADGIALLALEISGDAPRELQTQVQLAIVTGLREGHTVMDLKETHAALDGSSDLIGCFTSDCLERISDSIGVTRFVRAVLTTSGAHYELKLQLLHVGDKRLLNSTMTSCAVCTIADLTERTTNAARQLLIFESNELVTVTIASSPDGAIVSIDGLEAGKSPVVADLEPGPHRVSAVRDGYATTAKTIKVVAGGEDARTFELALTKPIGDSAGERPNYGYLKWGSVAASGTLLVLGTTLIVIDNNPTCGSSTGQCKFLRQTMLGGVVSIVGSVAAGAAAGWMFWSDSRRERPTLSIGPSGASAGIAFDF